MFLRCGFFDACLGYRFWTKTNVEVLEMAKVKQTLLRTIQERKLQYFEHFIQGKGKQKLLKDRKIVRSRCRGQQRTTWTSDVTDWCGLSYTKCVKSGGK